MKKILNKITELLRSWFLNGLLIILPVALTLILFNATFKLVKRWFAPLQAYLPAKLAAFPHSEIVIVLVAILLVGIIVRFFVLRPIIHIIEEQFVLKIPLIRPVYSGIKQLVSAFTSQDQLSFNTVVMLEFPSAGIYSLGFMTGVFPEALTKSSDKYYNIYVPTTPNPTTGFFVLLPEHRFKVIDLTRQEAMSIIMSGGIIKPERFTTIK